MVRIIRTADIAGLTYGDTYDRAVDGVAYLRESPEEPTGPSRTELRAIEREARLAPWVIPPVEDCDAGTELDWE